MDSIWMMGTIYTALGFGVGGILAWVVKGFPKQTDTVYCLCAGMILGLLSLEVAPEAIEMGNWLTFITGFFIGVLVFNLLHNVAHFLHLHTKDRKSGVDQYIGILLLISISIHNLPIGISLGASPHIELSHAILQTMLLHNIPEGLIVFTLWSDLKKRTIPIISLFISLPVGAGAYVGSKLGMMGDPFLWSMFISLSIGMIYLATVKEILTESIQELCSAHVFLLTLLGFGLIWIYFSIL